MMEAIIERTPKTVTVRMSTRRWDRLQKMEQAYKLSRIIKRSMKQAETAPAMTVDEAMNFIDKL
jgi:16S rRNA U1498 N3-methylase RsmE